MPPPNGPGPWGRAFRAPLEFASGALLQVPAHLLRGGRNIASLMGMVPGEGPMDHLSGKFGEMLRGYEEWESRVGPQGLAGDLGAIAGELGMTAAEIIYTGGAIRGAASLGKLGKGGEWLGRRSGNFMGEAVKDAIAVAPIDAVYAINPETSVTQVASHLLPQGSAGQRAAEQLNRTFVGRLAGEMGVGTAADVTFRSVGSGLKGGYALAKGERPETFLASGYHPGEAVQPLPMDLDEVLGPSNLDPAIRLDAPTDDMGAMISSVLKENASTMPSPDRLLLNEALSVAKIKGDLTEFEPVLRKYGLHEGLEYTLGTEATKKAAEEKSKSTQPFLAAARQLAPMAAGGVGLAGMAIADEGQQQLGGAALAMAGLVGAPGLYRGVSRLGGKGTMQFESKVGKLLSEDSRIAKFLSDREKGKATTFSLPSTKADGAGFSWEHIFADAGIARDEQEWTGLLQWLQQHKGSTLSLDDLNGYMERHGLRINEFVNESKGIAIGADAQPLRYQDSKFAQAVTTGREQRTELENFVGEHWNDQYDQAYREEMGVYRAGDHHPNDIDYIENAPAQTLIDDARLLAGLDYSEAGEEMMEKIRGFGEDTGGFWGAPRALFANDIETGRMDHQYDEELISESGLDTEFFSGTNDVVYDRPSLMTEGGDVHREIIITLDRKPDRVEGVDEWNEVGKPEYGGGASRDPGRSGEHGEPAPRFDEPHWGAGGTDPGGEFTDHLPELDNALLHIRYQIRTTPVVTDPDGVVSGGERVLFIDEIQSEWHQRARKYGYKGYQREDGTWVSGEEEVAELRAEIQEARFELANHPTARAAYERITRAARPWVKGELL